jgi:hypothetical protein
MGPFLYSEAVASSKEAELASVLGLRDPPPIWDGKDPAKRWLQKRRDLMMWARDTDIPKAKLGVRFWRLGLPDDSPAKTIINGLKDREIVSEEGFEIMIATLDRAYAGFHSGRDIREGHV